jgi:hypothetical protein
MRESRESSPIQVDSQGLVTSAEGVDAHIELPASKEERIEQVALADIGLGRVIPIEGLPLGDVLDLIEDEDALALALAGLHEGTGTGFMIQRVLLSFCVFLNSS